MTDYTIDAEPVIIDFNIAERISAAEGTGYGESGYAL